MLTQEEKDRMRPVIQSLESALFTQRDTVEALLTAYRQANRSFAYRNADADPESLLMAVQASSIGLATLCSWLMEAGMVLDTRYWNKAIEHRSWLDRRLEEAGVEVPSLPPL